VVNILKLLNELLCWDLPEIPSRNSIENWVKKSGYALYKEPFLQTAKEDYGLIIDESMMIGNERMLLTLGVAAHKKTETPLTAGDVNILGIKVNSKWDHQSIKSCLEETSASMPSPPKYVIADNDLKLAKAIHGSGFTHIRDIGHTLGMFMERIYKRDNEFISYMKALSEVRSREVMNSTAYLLPPKQRTVARFLNLSTVTDWSAGMLQSIEKLNRKERETFNFIKQYASLIDELQEVLSAINHIQEKIKTQGLSYESLNYCRNYVLKALGKGNERMIKLSAFIVNYVKEEILKLEKKDACWNASSDIIESIFGCYKSRKSPIALHGVTSFVLFIPILALSEQKNNPGNFKQFLEKIYLRDIHQWTKDELTENQAVKRRKAWAA
jgi:hypothetical protein